MSRLLRVPVQPLASGDAVLSSEASHYLVRVQRAPVGTKFLAFDPVARTECGGTLLEASPKAARCRFDELRASTQLPGFELTLIQGLGKGDKLDQIVRDATALGVTRIVPAECARSVARISEGRARGARLASIASAAAAQCLRGDVPSIEEPAQLANVLERFKTAAACRIYLNPTSDVALLQRLPAATPELGVVLLIGPEGGFDRTECASAEAAGFVAASLGRFVLRTETAALAALAIVMGRFA